MATLIVIALICGVITGVIGQRKNIPVGGAFACGLLLGPIGVLIMAIQRPGVPKPPPHI